MLRQLRGLRLQRLGRRAALHGRGQADGALQGRARRAGGLPAGGLWNLLVSGSVGNPSFNT